MRRYLCVVSVLLCAVAASACISAISKNLDIESSDWSVHVDKITDGPHSYSNVINTYKAKPGYKFIWSHMRVKNRLTTPRAFDLRGITLVAGDMRVRPGNIPLHKDERSTPDIPSQGQYKTELLFMVPTAAVPTKLIIPGVGELKLQQREAAPVASGSSACFSVGEVAAKSFIVPGTKDRPTGRDAQKAHVVQVARKIGVEITADDMERIVQQAFHELYLRREDLGMAIAEECLTRGGHSVAPELANVCFQVARYTGEFALGKKFNTLDRELRAIDKTVADPLERKLTRELATKVYQSNVTTVDSHKFAAEFYSQCLTTGGSKP